MIARRLLRSFIVFVTVAVLAAVVLGTAGLYLSGHGANGLMRERLTIAALGVHLSAGDMLCLGAAFAAGMLSWRVGRISKK